MKIYAPSQIKDVSEFVYLHSKKNLEDRSLYSKIDYILNDFGKFEDKITEYSIEKIFTNPFVCLYQWLKGNSDCIDYPVLIRLFPLVSLRVQMKIVKRYFHDIRHKKTKFDPQLLAQFRENQYSEFIRYRYCLVSPEEPIDLSVSFLCDCILTIYQTNGLSFQSFDGILDFVMTRCDVTKPAISLGMDKFIPQCHGGAVYNSKFRGFIDYSVVCELDESKFTEDNLRNTIIDFFEKNKKPHCYYYTCAFNTQNIPLSYDEKSCLTHIKKSCATGEMKFSCVKKCYYKYKWVVLSSDYTWLNIFFTTPLPVVDANNKSESFHIDISQTSTEVLSNHIKSLTEKCEKIDEKKFVVKSKDIKGLYLLLQYSKPISFRIIPHSNTLIGGCFDFWGIRKTLLQDKDFNALKSNEERIAEIHKRESEEVLKRVVETLNLELNRNSFNGAYFEVEYNRELLRKILGIYYYNGSKSENSEGEIFFLKSKILKKFRPFCAPKLADVHNRATELPFFWCCGIECFYNNLHKQNLETCVYWENYSLYHMIEILGFSKLKETEAGLEPDSTVSEFIACANRVIKKFKRLKCRKCGHLMYTDRSSGYNRYNYYSCINPACTEHYHPVYLSYCFRCKKGLIDSRDSAQCPNGWYICPECYACCDDAQYERQAQKYLVQNRPVPERIRRMLGLGHNDKEIYFCHVCGEKLGYFDYYNEQVWGCVVCQKIYK